MASERRRITIGDLGRIITGKTPPTSRTEYFGGTIPFVTPKDMDGRKTIDRTERFLTNEGAQSVHNAILEPPRYPLLTRLHSQSGHQTQAGLLAGEDAGHVCPSLDLLV